MRIIVLDFETYWDSKEYTLSKMGPVSYIRDPRFSAQLMSFIVSDSSTMTYDKVRVAEHDNIPAVLSALRLDASGTVTVAHNGNGFDFIILSEIYHIVPWLALDTMCMERWTGVSRMQSESLKAMTKFFGCGEKLEGTVISDGRKWPDDFTKEERIAFAQYCRNDTEQCFKCFRIMLPYMTADAILFSSVTAKMACSPVLRLDDDMLTAYLDELTAKVTRAREEINFLFRFKSDEDFLKAIRSSQAFVKMLAILGRKPPMKYSAAKSETKKKQLEAEGKRNLTEEDYAVYTPALAKSDLDFTAMAFDADERVALLVRTRLENNSSIQKSRAETFHALAKSGKPMPVMLNAFKAHTSRYTAGNSEGSSDRLNLQNLSKRDPSQLTLRKAVQAPDGMALVACDSSQIEARILAYVANETELVDAFRRGADPYADLAEKIFQIPSEEIHRGAKSGDKKLKAYRNVGKTGILSAGYGVGWRKYADTLLRQGVRLSSDIDQHYEMAHHAHNVYRASNASIVNFWDTCQTVIKALYLGYSGEFGGPADNIFRYGPAPVCGIGSVPTISGPNGYALRYYKLTCQESESNGKPEYYYIRPKSKSELKTKIYGGALTENLCQYLAFALLQWQACRMTEKGVRLIANIHDSFLAVCLEGEAERIKSVMESCMSQVPEWLPGFPVACEAEIGRDYCIA